MAERTEPLQILLTDKEMRYVERLAKAEARTRSSWGRQVIIRAIQAHITGGKATTDERAASVD